MYTRKTVDVYIVFGNYGYGWSYLLYEDTLAEAKRVKREYVENEVGMVFKIVKKRVSKEIYNNDKKFYDWLSSL